MFVAVVVVCFWRSSWLAFLILTYYIKLMHQFLTPLSYLLWRLSYRSYRIFWKRLFAKNNFWVFLSVPHLLDSYAKIVDGRGRNFMCHRTLPSRLVHYAVDASSLILWSVIMFKAHIFIDDCNSDSWKKLSVAFLIFAIVNFLHFDYALVEPSFCLFQLFFSCISSVA